MRVLLISLCVCCFVSTSANSQDRQWGSYFDALAANYSAVEQFDALVIEHSFKGHGTQLMEAKIAKRLVFDPDNERALILKFGIVTNAADGTEHPLLSSLLVTGDRYWVHSFPEQQVERVSRGIATLVDRNFPDLLTIGTRSYPHVLFGSVADADNYWTQLSGNATQYGKGVLRADRLELIVTFPFRRANQETETANQFAFRFDPVKLVPTSWSSQYLSRGVYGEKTVPRRRESYQWTNKGGINLPHKIQITSAIARLAEDGTIVLDEGSTEVEIHWLAVNERLDEELWSSERWSDFDEIRSGCQLAEIKSN